MLSQLCVSCVPLNKSLELSKPPFCCCSLYTMGLGQRIQLWDTGAEGENCKKTLKLETTFEVNNWKWFSYWKGFKPQLDYSTIYDHTRHWSSMDQPPTHFSPLLWAVGQFLTGESVFPPLPLTCSTGESLGFECDGVKSLSVCLPTSWHSKKAYLYTCMLSCTAYF